MKSRYLAIFDQARETLNYAVAVTASIDLLLEDEAKLQLTIKDKQTLQSLREKLQDEKSTPNVLTLLLHHLNNIQNKIAHVTMYQILKDVEAIYINTRDSNLVTPSAMSILTSETQDHQQDDEWGVNVRDMLRRKNLNLAMFRREPSLSIDSDFSQHVKWAWHNIYSKDYVGEERRHSDIPRYVHGITHVTNVAVYVPVLANLYRRHGDQSAQQLTDEDIKLLQIGALLHDAARENEGEDLWDHESGIMIYLYLTRVCGANPDKAKMVACAVANKDINPSGEFELFATADGKDIHYRFNKRDDHDSPQKSIYQKIIHDADCLDIIRARPVYDASYLDFYQEIASKSSNELALDEMAQLITEVRHLVELRGDGYNRINPTIKLRYENANALQRLQVDIQAGHFPMLSSLGNELINTEELRSMTPVDLSPYQPDAELTSENFMAAIREGRVFARGVASPSAIANNNKETLAELELRKTLREPGIATASQKEARDKKHGNPLRSISMLGYGSRTFTNAGFLVIDPPLINIKEIGAADFGTGRGKKSTYASAMANNPNSTSKKGEAEKKRKLDELNKKLKMGGQAYISKDLGNYVANHSEITCDLKRFDAIYVSPDHNLYNLDVRGNEDMFHQHTAIIQAVYLQKLYEQKLRQEREKFIAVFGAEEGAKKFRERFGEVGLLPIFSYSGVANTARKLSPDEYTDEALLGYWQQACSDFLAIAMQTKSKAAVLFTLTLDSFKTLAVSGNEQIKYNGNRPYFSKTAPLDSCYSPALKAQLDASLNEMLSVQRSRVLDELFQENSPYQIPGNEEELHLITYFAIDNQQEDLLVRLFAKYPEIKHIAQNNEHSMQIFLRRAIELNNPNLVRLLLAHMKNITIPGEQFHLAVQSGSVEIVTMLLDHGTAHQYVTADGSTMLHEAAKAGNLEMVKKLVPLYSDMNTQTHYRYTPLYFAAVSRHVAVAEYLLSKGADPNILAHNGSSMLIDCIKQGAIEMVKLLLANKADPMVPSGDDYALHVAALDGHTEIVAELLKMCDVNLRDKRSSTPLHRAAYRNREDVMRLLLSKGAVVDAVNLNGATALEVASEYGGDTACIALLLQHGADPKHEFSDTFRWNALRLAARAGHNNIVALLLQQNDMSVNSADPLGLTALYVAAEHGKVEMVKLLLDAGANVDPLFRNQFSPLFIAVQFKHVDVVACLLEHGAAITEESDILKMAKELHGHDSGMVKLLESYCSIQHAIKHENVNAVSYWLKRGADVNDLYDNRDHSTLLVHAAQHGNVAIVRLLLEHGARVKNTGWFNPMEVATHPDIIKLLLEYGADDINQHAIDGLTPLMKAVKNGRVKVVESLLQCGADPNIHSRLDNNADHTALHMAATWHSSQCAELLLACPGINVNACDNEGKTALHIAVNTSSEKEQNSDITTALVAAHADLNARDQNGMTPLAIAAKALNHKALLILLHHGADLNVLDNTGKDVIALAADSHAQLNRPDHEALPSFKHRSPAYEECETIKILFAHVNLSFAIHHIKQYAVMQSVMKRCANPNAVDPVGNYLLHHCAMEVDTLFLIPLLNMSGVNLEVKDKMGRTPLMVAVMSNNFNAAQELLRCGADINTKDNNGKTLEDYLESKSKDSHYGFGWGGSRYDAITNLLETYRRLPSAQPASEIKKSY